MGKVTSDKVRIQTLHELGLGYRRITSKFPVHCAFVVTLIIDLTYVCFFATLKAKAYSKTWSFGLTNCALILHSCSVKVFALMFKLPLCLKYWRKWSKTSIADGKTGLGTVPENLAGKFRTAATIMHFVQWGFFIAEAYIVTLTKPMDIVQPKHLVCHVFTITVNPSIAHYMASSFTRTLCRPACCWAPASYCSCHALYP